MFKDKGMMRQVSDIFIMLKEKEKKHLYGDISLQADWCHYGVALHRADILMKDGKFQEALNKANKIWFRIKENGQEDKLKEE
jgi:hypothetical protein